MSNLKKQRTKKQAVVFYIYWCLLLAMLCILFLITPASLGRSDSDILKAVVLVSAILEGQILDKKWVSTFVELLIIIFIIGLIIGGLYMLITALGLKDTIVSVAGAIAIFMIPVAYSTTLKPKEVN